MVVIQTRSINTGQPYVVDQNTTMPLADVNISIVISEQWHYDISLRSRFQIFCGNTANLTLAFVYPSSWHSFSDYSPTVLHFFTIALNGSEVEYDILTQAELAETYIPNAANDSYLYSCNFAVFSTAVSSNTTYLVDVDSDFELNSTENQFYFDYVVGTAKSWSGNTHETVRMRVTNLTQFESCSFYPSTGLEINKIDNNTHLAIWDFNISSFEGDVVAFQVEQRRPEYHGMYPPEPAPLLVAIVLLVIFAPIIALAVYLRRWP
ncbi:MAG: hypothetical protein K9W43_14090 [Candidatus Thorarchaeota archaeon]|nr:hypothetical protein [Candidatus Thorarchaeota archaeon]